MSYIKSLEMTNEEESCEPVTIDSITANVVTCDMPSFLMAFGRAITSRTEAKRLIKQGIVKIDDFPCYDYYPMVAIGDIIAIGGKYRQSFLIVDDLPEEIPEEGS